MISALRSKAAKIVTYFFVILLILGFVAWGIGDVLPTGGANNTVAAKVGEEQILPEDVRLRYREETNRLRAILGNALTPERAKALGLATSVLKDMVNNSLYNQGANQLGLVVSNDHIRQTIQNDKTFKNQIGEFDRNNFQAVLRTNEYTEGSYIRDLRQNMIRNQLLESIETAAIIPELMKNKIYNYREEKRLAAYIHIEDKSVKAVSAPNNSELEAFYKKNTARFTAPEYRALTLAILHADDLAKEIAVSDEAIQNWYDSRLDEYTKSEKREIKQILLTDEKKATDAYTMLQTGRDFAAVAKDVAGMDEKSLDLGTVTKRQLSRDLSPGAAEVVFNLKKDTPSIALKSALGWHIIKVVKIEQGSQKKLSEVKESIRKSLAREKAIDSLFKLGNKLEDSLAGGATLEEAANKLNLKLRKISAIDRSGRDTTGTSIKDLPKEGDVVGTAFTTDETQESQLKEIGTDGYFIVRVDKITKPALRPLDSIRADAVKAWQAERRKNEVKKQAKVVLDQLKSGKALGAIADKRSIKVISTKVFDRLGRGLKERLPPALIDQLFGALPGDAVMARDKDSYVVAQLKDIKPVNFTAGDENMKELVTDIKQSIGNDLMTQLATGLRKKLSVTINQRALDQIY